MQEGLSHWSAWMLGSVGETLGGQDVERLRGICESSGGEIGSDAA